MMLVTFLSSCGNKQLRKSERLGEEVYVYYDMEIPTALGAPQLSADYYTEKKSQSADSLKDEINTYADAMAYFRNSDHNFSDETFIRNFRKLLDKDYELIDMIYIELEDGYQNVFCIKANDRYYLLDPLSTYLGNSKWLQDYKLENGSFESKEELLDALLKGYPNSRVINTFYAPKDPDGKEIELSYKDGEFTYYYKSWDYSLGYGLPILSEKEINELISEAENGNYDEIRNRITTIPDMVYFLKRNGFKQTGRSNIVSTDAYDGADVGNIRYNDDRLGYTISGRESLIVNEGQCSSTATLLHYLLADDYEEVGYVPIVFVSNDDSRLDGHAINYVKSNGKYYLVSPSYYLTGDNAWSGFYELRKGYLSLEEAMDHLFGSYYPNGKVISTAAYVFDGIYVSADERETDRVSKRSFPSGSDVKVCLGSDYDFLEPKHPVDQDYILGVTIKK